VWEGISTAHAAMHGAARGQQLPPVVQPCSMRVALATPTPRRACGAWRTTGPWLRPCNARGVCTRALRKDAVIGVAGYKVCTLPCMGQPQPEAEAKPCSVRAAIATRAPRRACGAWRTPGPWLRPYGSYMVSEEWSISGIPLCLPAFPCRGSQRPFRPHQPAAIRSVRVALATRAPRRACGAWRTPGPRLRPCDARV
jgi:hypothetical protein